MSALPGKTGGTIVVLLVAGILISLVELSPLVPGGGSLLMALLFGIAVVEGSVAAAAASTMVNARWVASVGRELLSVSPLLLLISLLFLLLTPFVESYPWAGREGIWFDKTFFIGRNVAFLLLAFVTASRFAAAVARDDARRKTFAATYLFVFVVSQSLTAYDLVMSLEYPWISTLLGGYFFIEATYGGFAVAAIVYVLLYGWDPGPADPDVRNDLKDLSVLMFGFSLLWAGLFFAQFLTIWYGNIPEEVSFVFRRVAAAPYKELSLAVLFLFFFIPFPALLATRAKSSRPVVFAVALSILTGILVERYVFLAPAVRLSPAGLAVYLAGLLVPFVLLVARGARGRTHRDS